MFKGYFIAAVLGGNYIVNILLPGTGLVYVARLPQYPLCVGVDHNPTN